MKILLELCTIIPDEFESKHLRVPPNKKQEACSALRSNASSIIGLLESFTFNVDLHPKILRCLVSWLRLNAVTVSLMSGSHLMVRTVRWWW